MSNIENLWKERKAILVKADLVLEKVYAALWKNIPKSLNKLKEHRWSNSYSRFVNWCNERFAEHFDTALDKKYEIIIPEKFLMHYEFNSFEDAKKAFEELQEAWFEYFNIELINDQENRKFIANIKVA